MINVALQNNWHEIESIGIAPAALAPLIYCETGNNPITRNIHLTKRDKGKVYAFVARFNVLNESHTRVTVGTHRHGGQTFTFDSYTESRKDKPAWIDYRKQKLPIKPPAPAPTYDADSIARFKRFKSAREAFESANSVSVSNHAYIVKKGVDTAGVDIRLVDGKLQYAFYDINGTLKGYQTIDAAGVKRPVIAKSGDMAGAFTVIGNAELIKFGAIFVEGLATGLSAYHSEKLNPKQLPVVVCLSAGNLRKVVALLVSLYGNDCVNLYADNDCGLNDKGKFTGNTGEFVALEICNQHGIKSYRLPVSGGAKCDFNDTEEFTDVIVPTGIDYQRAIIAVAPTNPLKRLFKDFANEIIRETRINAKTGKNTADFYTIDECIEIITSTAALRQIDSNISYLLPNAIARQIARKEKYLVNDCDVTKIAATTTAVMAKHGIDCDSAVISRILSKEVAKRREIQRHLKTIADYLAFNEVMNMDGYTPAGVAGRLEYECELTPTMVFDNGGMGAGKTNRMVAYSKGLTGGVAYISPLVSVCKNSGERLDFLDYQSMSLSYLSANSHNVNAVFCINSIPKFDLSSHFSHLLVDEAAAVYDSIFDDNGTNKHQQKQLIDELRKAFTAVDSIIISDAGLADRHVHFYKSLCDNKRAILFQTTPATPATPVNHYLLQNHSHSHELILSDLRAGLKGVVACDTVGNAIAVKKYLIENGADPKRILLATGENDGEIDVMDFIEKPDKYAHLYDVVIHSPLIRSGTSIEYKGYEFAYLLYDGIVSTGDAMQMWGRCRNAKNRSVSFGAMIDKTRVTDFDLLFEIDVENEVHELNQKGSDITAAQYRATFNSNNEIARLRHDFTATSNADKNDFKNNFLFHCEISGRDIIRIESETKMDKGLTAEVKIQRCTDRHAAAALSELDYQHVKQAKRRLQHETDAMKRFETVAMAFGNNAEIDSVITVDDCVNEINGTIKPLLNYESLATNIDTLKALDKIDKENDCLKFSRVKLQKALNEIVTPLTVTSDGIDKKVFGKTCDKLEKHCVILAAAGLGNFKKINRIRAGFTVGNLLEKLGFDMNQIGQNGTGNREKIYQIKVNDDIARYAAQRIGCS
jgi:hypothetical protein